MFTSNEICELKTQTSHVMSGDTLLHLIIIVIPLVMKTSSLYAHRICFGATCMGMQNTCSVHVRIDS